MHRTLDWWSVSHMVIYMFRCYSLKSSHPCLLPQDPKICSLCLSLFCYLAYRVIITIFLNSIYMCWYTVLVFFFLAYFTLYNRLQFHPSHQNWFKWILFIIARTWKQPRCPSADEWIRKLWYIYTMEYYSAIKKNCIYLKGEILACVYTLKPLPQWKNEHSYHLQKFPLWSFLPICPAQVSILKQLLIQFLSLHISLCF